MQLHAVKNGMLGCWIRLAEQQKTALLPAPFWCTYAWNRPTSTGAGGSDPLWLCWRGKPWLAIRWRGYAASKWSQLEWQLNFRPAAITNRDIAASAFIDDIAGLCCRSY